MSGRNFLKRISSLLIGVVAGILLAEIAVRLLGIAPEIVPVERGRFKLSENEILGYEPVCLTYSGDVDDFIQYRGASNDMGFRDIRHTVKKPDGTFRILILGDSIAAGVYIDEYKDTFPAQLQQRMNAHEPPVEIINFGVAGYNTRQEVELLKDRGLPFDPDLVVVAYCLNDRFQVDGGILKGLHETERTRSRVNRYGIHRYFVRSALYRLVRFRLMQEDPLDFQLDQQDDMDRLKGDTVRASFQKLKSLADAYGFRVMVVVFPNFKQLVPYPFIEEHHKIRHDVEANGFLYLDLLERYQAYWKATDAKLDFDFIHPTEIGHEMAAEWIAECIQHNYLEVSRSP